MLKKLTKEQYAEILALKPEDFDTAKRSKGISAYDVAKQFGVSHQTVYNIWRGDYKFPPNASPLDTQILKKMIPAFVEAGIKLKLEKNEITRITELFQEVSK